MPYHQLERAAINAPYAGPGKDQDA